MIRIVHTESSSGWGGQEMRILSESALLNQRDGFECTVLTVSDTQMIERGSSLRVPIQTAKIGTKSISGVLQMIHMLRSLAPDIVISHSSTDSWLVAIARYIARLPFTLIRVRHVSAPIAANRRNRWLYGQASVCVTTSKSIRQQVILSTELPEERVLSIPTGIDTVSRFVPVDSAVKAQLRRSLQIPHNQFIALMVSTLRSWKGHRFAFDALTRVPGCHLVVLGDGPQFDALRKLAIELGIDDRVSFKGYVANVEAYMQAADVFLQPSTANEGVSQALLQAGACQIPVIAADIGGLNEVVMHGLTGLLLSPGCGEAISESLIRLMQDPVMAFNLGAALRTHVIRHGSEQVMVDRMIGVIHALVGKTM